MPQPRNLFVVTALEVAEVIEIARHSKRICPFHQAYLCPLGDYRLLM